MISLNGEKIELSRFPDHTLLAKYNVYTKRNSMSWRYESDAECFAVYALAKHILSKGCEVSLILPYIPNARQDRCEDSVTVFTLKYFADFINSIGFSSVIVLDPHSNVAPALIDRVKVITAAVFVPQAMKALSDDFGVNDPLLFFPDEGAMKRYGAMLKKPYSYGVKHRDWESGNITGYELIECEPVSGCDILIVDDICSKGGTFLHAAKALKEKNASRIFLYITHCENTVLEGEMLSSGLIERIFTTDSIFTGSDERIDVIKI